MKLKSQLVLLVLMAVLPVVVFASVMVWRDVRLHRKAVEQGLQDTTRALSLAVDREIGTVRAVLETLATSPDLDSRDFRSFYDLCLRAVALQPKGSRIILFDRSGQQIINTVRSFGESLPNPFRQAAAPGKDPRYPDLPLGGAESVKRAFDTGRFVLSDMFLALSTKEPTIVISVPVIRNGTVFYVLEMSLRPESLTHLLVEQRVPPDRLAIIVDRKGAIIGRNLAPERFVGLRAPSDLITEMAQLNEGLGTFTSLEGVPLYHAFTRSNFTGWSTVVGAPQAAFDKAAERSVGLVAGGGLTLLLLGLSAALVFGKRISRPIVKLAGSADSIQRGEPVEIGRSAVRELQHLSHALRAASEAVRQRAEEREQRLVAETRQQEAETAKQKLTNILESIADGFCAFDHEWRFTYINGRAEEDLARQNLKRDELFGKVLWEVFPEQAGTRWHAGLQRAMKERVPLTCEFYYRPLNEWYEDRVSPTPDGGVGIYRRVMTERKRAEQSLAQAVRQQEALYHFLERRHRAKSLEEIYDAALEAILSALRSERASILLFDESEVMRFVAWRKLSEDYRKAVEGHSPWKPEDANPQPVCVPDVAAAELDESLKAVMTGEGIGALAFIPLVVNGRLAGTFMTYYDEPHIFDDEELDLSLTIARQIALGIERNRAEQALRESERRLAYALEATVGGVWDWNIRTGEVLYSRNWIESLGYTVQEVPPHANFRESIVHPDDRPRVREALDAHLNGQTPFYQFENRLRMKSGAYRWNLDRGKVVEWDRDGKPLRMVGTDTDITERKRAEEALKEADRRKDEFLAMLGHELRNPLGVISNSVQVLQVIQSADPQLHEWREIIERQVQHMARMLDDLLDVSRISRGRIQLKRERCDIVAIVRATAEDYRTILNGCNLWLELDVPRGPVWVSGDAVRLAQALSNLLQNAGKFTESGGTVKVKLQTKGNETAVVIVEDTGIGIEPEMLAWVFEPFSQADKSLHRTRGGLGLGLSLVKGIVELHGGEVEARSQGPGRGSEFMIRLPIENTGADSSPVLPDSSASRPHRILVIEDNPVAARGTRVLLEQSGHTVEVAHNGTAGLEMAQRFRPEVVLCDIGLPGMDGYEVAQALRERIGLRDAYVVAVSGYAQDERRTRSSGFDAYLTKPLDFDELEQMLARLGRRSAAIA